MFKGMLSLVLSHGNETFSIYEWDDPYECPYCHGYWLKISGKKTIEKHKPAKKKRICMHFCLK